MPRLLQDAGKNNRVGSLQSGVGVASYKLSPQLLKGLIDVLLQSPLHSLNQLHLLLQLLLHRVGDQFVPTPPLSQHQALGADLQGGGGGGKGLLSQLFGLHTLRQKSHDPLKKHCFLKVKI